MEILPGAPLVVQGGLVALLLLLVLAFVVAILQGRLLPRSTTDRMESIMEKRYQGIKEAYEASEAARHEALEVARESLETSRNALAVLEELRRRAEER